MFRTSLFLWLFVFLAGFVFGMPSLSAMPTFPAFSLQLPQSIDPGFSYLVVVPVVGYLCWKAIVGQIEYTINSPYDR